MVLATPALADWRAEADARIEKIRKGDFALKVVDAEGKALAGRDVKIRQTRSHFGFGTAVDSAFMADDPDTRRYRQFIVDHFSMLTAENAMKWWDIEKEKDAVDFAPADALAKFARENDLPLRGHCVLWCKGKWVREWKHKLTPEQLQAELDQHLEALIPRYRGKVICWDVCNEILDGTFYRERLGPDIYARVFKRVAELDPDAVLFTNEYSILTIPPRVEEYIRLIKSLQEAGAPVRGIGVQDHGVQRFSVDDGPPATQPWQGFRRRWGPPQQPRLGPREILASLDRLGELNLPIHITEVSSITPDEELRARTMEMFLRVCFSHPKVESFIFWGFWSKNHFKQDLAALVDENWNYTPTGRVVFKMLDAEWRTNLELRTGPEGDVAFRGFFGRYEVTTADDAGQTLTGTVKLIPTSGTATVTLRPAPPSTQPHNP